MHETKYQALRYEAGVIDPLNKAIGKLEAPLAPGDAGGTGWRLLDEALSLPAAVLYEERLAHNLAWMRRFMDEYGVQLAPHGKTTMAPKLFARQLAAGAWGITLATAHQTAAAYAHGVRRVLMANQLVGRRNMEIVADLLRDPAFEFFSLVDSAELADPLGAFFRARAMPGSRPRCWPRWRAGPMRCDWPASRSTKACSSRRRISAASCGTRWPSRRHWRRMAASAALR
jgi:D-serine dehydratase